MNPQALDEPRVSRKTKPSSHREFFQRIYGNLEKSNSLAEKLLDDRNKNNNAKLNPDLLLRRSKSIWNEHGFCNSTPILFSNCNLRSHHCNQPLHFPLKPFDSTVHKESVPFGFSAFLARKKRKEGKIRRQRTTFSSDQTSHLESEFRINEYIPRDRRYELADYLQLTEMQIKIWFQNRRAKDKRIEKAQLDQQYRSLLLTQKCLTLPVSYHHEVLRPTSVLSSN